MITLDHDPEANVQRRSSRLRPPGFWHAWLIGPPLPTAAAPHQTVGKAVGLAVFASDALSSTAYATQEILLILAVAGMGAFGYALPISWAIVGLLAIVTLSYQQTIYAYPGGGGAYIVARDNLGDLAAQIAGAALLVDYVLTVAVSVSSGVAQLTSAYPPVFPVPGGARGRPRAADHAGQPTRRAGVRRDLRPAHLRLPDDDGPDGGNGIPARPHGHPRGRGGPPRPRRDARGAGRHPLPAPPCLRQRHHGLDRRRGHL